MKLFYVILGCIGLGLGAVGAALVTFSAAIGSSSCFCFCILKFFVRSLCKAVRRPRGGYRAGP